MYSSPQDIYWLIRRNRLLFSLSESVQIERGLHEDPGEPPQLFVNVNDRPSGSVKKKKQTPAH